MWNRIEEILEILMEELEYRIEQVLPYFMTFLLGIGCGYFWRSIQ